MPFWADLYKVWSYQGELDPIMRREVNKEIEGAGVTVPDAIQDIRSSGEYFGGTRGVVRLRDSNDFVDLSSVTNRQSRYKEYERLRMVPEIENAITIFADEACMVGDTLVATPFGMIKIEDLANTKKPDERFLVYCYDFTKKDYTLGWAHHPRKTKKSKTIVVTIENGEQFECTADHRVLLANKQWIEAGKLQENDEIMAFYRFPANTGLDRNQFARVFTQTDGWIRERDFIDEWKGKIRDERTQKLYRITKCITEGCNTKQTSYVIQNKWSSIDDKLTAAGFCYKELKELGYKRKNHKVIAIWESSEEKDVYDLSVDKHENFCTNIGVFHNCQIGESGHMFDIIVKNQDIKEELEFLFFHPSMINIDDNLWGWCRDLFLFGDHFMELVIDPDEPKLGILKVQVLPPESVFRIETIKGKTVEFQQGKEGPDYQSLARVEVTKATEADLAQANAIRFNPQSIVHFKIGGHRKTFHPYGVSLIEAARGPAHQLKLMEDCMLIYRLSRAPERRVFYIDVGQLPPFKAEAFMNRLQDMFRKKKTFSSKGGVGGAGPVEERWQAPSQDEDFWIPLRPNSNTRVETLPGAQNLGEIDDALYFRNKLFISMCFPKNYMAQEDPAVTKMTLSSVDVKFARLIERLQRGVAAGLTELAVRHLQLKGFPISLYEDLQIKMTPPSHYREISENEVKDARVNRLSTLKGTMVLSDLDLLVDVMHYPEEEAKQKVARAMTQKLQELKLQVMSQNPQLLGIAMPEPGKNEMGTDAQGPTPSQMPGQEAGGQPPPQQGQEMEAEPGQEGGMSAMDTYGQNPPQPQGGKIPEPEEQEIRQYDMEILDLSKGIDEEEVDEIEVD
jgi:hypothetical protein